MDIWGSEPPCAWAELDPWKRGRGSKRGLAWGSDKLVRDAKNERERRGQHRALGVRAPAPWKDALACVHWSGGVVRARHGGKGRRGEPSPHRI